MRAYPRRSFLKGMAGAAASSLLPRSYVQARDAAPPLNVVMIAIDDMNDWVGAFGNRAHTPNIDKLAQQGVAFNNAHCVVACCNPSRVALMTGLRPETTGQFNNYGNFRDRHDNADLLTLPQHFRTCGYEAVAAGKLFHLSRGTGEEPDPRSDPQSWNRQRVGLIGTAGHELYLNEDGFAKWHDGKFDGYLGKFPVWGPSPEPKEETGDWQSADYCARHLTQEHESPFFLACGIFRPHSPQLAPKEFFDLYPLEDIKLPEAPEHDFNDIPELAHENFTTRFFLEGIRDMGQWPQAVQGYLASMTFADACVGHLLDALEKGPHRDNTAVVLWTDHGWHLGTKNRWEKYSLWDDATCAPLIFRVPGITKPGGKCTRAVSLLDLYPTLAEICALSERPDLEGHSLVPLLRSPDATWDGAAVTTDYWTPSYSVKREQWNYIRYVDGSEELYDRSRDPNEFENLASWPEYASLKRQLTARIPTPKSHPKWRTHEAERAWEQSRGITQ